MSLRRSLFSSFVPMFLLAGASSLMAYPVAITINANFSPIAGDPDPLNLGTASPNTVTITTTIDSSTPQATYPAMIVFDLPAADLSNSQATGTLAIGTNGQITANFTTSLGTFSAVLVLEGVTFPSPVPTAFGTANFTAPASTVTYNIGETGTVGITGTITALGLTASPTSITANYTTGGTAPAAQTISVTSNDPATPAIAYTATLTPTNGAPANFATLSTTSGTTPGNVSVSFPTTLNPGTYTGDVDINSGSGAPISIPVTYTVTQGQVTPPPPSGLSASPSSLSFSFTTGGMAPAAQTVAVASKSSSSLSFTVSSSASWLTATASGSSTPATLTVTVDASSLPVGVSSGSITVSASGSTVTIPVMVTVSSASNGSGALQLTPSMLSFQFYPPGSTVSTQTISITSSDGSPTAFTAAVASGSFLTVSPTSGTTPANVTVFANPSGLSQGSTYNGSIVFTTASGTVTLPATASYAASVNGTTISASPASVNFAYTVGGAIPPAQSVNVYSSTPIHFTVNNPSFYLPITPNAATTDTMVSIALNPSGLNPGTFKFNLSIVPETGSAIMVPIYVTVTGATVPVPTITSAPASLTFSYTPSSGTPAAQTLAIISTAATPFTVTSSVPWLTVSPTTATGTGTITVTASATSLATGNYTGNITISAMGATSVTIPVTFNVTQVAPNLTFAPTAVAFAYAFGGIAPASQTVGITPNTSGLTYSVVAIGGTWLSATTSSDLSQVTVTVDPMGLVAGTYNGSLMVSGSGLSTSPLYVPVTFTVADGTTLGVGPTILTFTATANGPTAATQTISVAGSDAIPFTVSSDSPWLTVTASGTTTPATVTVSIAQGSMATGAYRGNITVTSSGSTAQTITIPVLLGVSTSAVPALTAITDAITYLHQYGAPGGIVSLFGTGIGPAVSAPLQVINGDYVSSLTGTTQVFADGIPCPLLFSSAIQVNAILPFALQNQTSAQVQLFYQGVASNVITLPIQANVPGIFSLDATGKNGGAILNQDLSVNSASNPAAAGTVVAIYGGGAGQTNPPGSDGLIVPVTTPFPAPIETGTVSVAGQPATIDYFGDAPGLVSGVLQINVVIPAGTPSGAQPITFTMGSNSSQPDLTVYVK